MRFSGFDIFDRDRQNTIALGAQDPIAIHCQIARGR